MVLDTNIVVSALIWGGVPFRLLQLGQQGKIEIVTSPALIAELANVLCRTHLAPHIAAIGMSALDMVTQYQSFAQSVTPQNVPAVIADDPDDDQVLACAVAGKADLIVSGDKHLLGLRGYYNGIPIVKAGKAVSIIEAA